MIRQIATNIKNTGQSVALLLVVVAAVLITSNQALACTTPDRNAAVKSLMEQYPGSKVLKVKKVRGSSGCDELHVRILVDGTVKVVVIKGD